MGFNIGYMTGLFGGQPVVAGTAAASQPLVLDSSKGIATITSATITTMTGNTVGLHTGTWRMTRGAAVAGAGTVQGDAAALIEGFQVITGANGTVGWILPTAVAGMIVAIKGTTAGVAKIWPATGAQINAVGANNAFSLASGAIPAIFIADSTTQWYSFPLVPS